MKRLKKRRDDMELQRTQNHIYLPLAAAFTAMTLYEYAGNRTVIALLCTFTLPSIFLNLIFILLPLYAKTYIMLKVSLPLFQLIIVTIVVVYSLNAVLVLGTLTQMQLGERSSAPMAQVALFLG